MSKSFREINTQIADLITDLEGLEAGQTEEETALLEALDSLAIERSEKLESIAYVRIQQKSDTKAIDDEIKRLQSRKKNIESAGRRLDQYCITCMSEAGIKKHTGKLASLTVAKSPLSAEVVNIDAVPVEYKEEVTTEKILKSEAIQHFKNTGEIVDGFSILQREHLRVK